MVPAQKLQALILTKNEAPNIQRVLDKLTWIEKVVVLDSYSNDETLHILERYTNVEIHFRTFDSFASQCNFGLELLNSEWILSLDADYVLTDQFIEETQRIIFSNQNQTAYFTKFKFLVFGRELLSDNTTPRAVLFLKNKGIYFDDGHAHRLKITGDTGFFKNYILHDDRKSLSRWLSNQDGYAIKECDKLLHTHGELSFMSRIRKNKIVAPFFVFFYCLFVKRLIFNGWSGWHYTLQRTMVEMLLALRLIEKEKLSQKELD